ncbi:MAG: chemotaxis protein CheW [Burkholderiaceae bacterium]|nr:chemotaxis protein CheW [Burkholderiaceae bacterium]
MASGKNLREFQVRLSERLRQAASAPPQSARLGVQVGDRNLLVGLSDVGEIVALPGAITPVPLTHEWFRGLVNLRGALYGVSDLARFEGRHATSLTKSSRLLAFAPRLGLQAAIVVDRMLGLQNDATLTEAQAGDSASAPGWLGRHWLDSEGRRWTELLLEDLASDERFLAVNR